MYRKERKKSRKISERVTQSSEDGSCGSPAMEDDDNQRPSSSSEDESSVEDENISIELTQELRDCLEQDHFLINVENRVSSTMFCLLMCIYVYCIIYFSYINYLQNLM